MKLLKGIKHYIYQKIYNAWEIIQKENDVIIAKQRKETQEKALSSFKSSFKHYGENVSFGKDLLLSGPEFIEIGDNFRALSHFRIQAMHTHADIVPTIKIGNDVSCEDFCHIGCIEKVIIGEGTLIASKVFIEDHSHGQTKTIDTQKPFDRELISKPVIIGKHCWLGDGACILPGVELGDNVIVGANAVVTHSFPSNSIIAGCPAKIIRTLK